MALLFRWNFEGLPRLPGTGAGAQQALAEGAAGGAGAAGATGGDSGAAGEATQPPGASFPRCRRAGQRHR